MTVELTPAPPRRYTVEEYIAIEEKSEVRHEFIDGIMIAIAGSSPEHGVVVLNIGAKLHGLLRGKPCRPYVNDIRLQVHRKGNFRYPDVIVACNPEFSQSKPQALLNPLVIIEVMSGSTSDIDKTDKVREYLAIESVRQYVLIDQAHPEVTSIDRTDVKSDWRFRMVDGIESVLTIPVLSIELNLSDIYEGVDVKPRSSDLN
jgi:Uma2 family endonuclease